MTLMIILGAVAALYMAVLLHRLSIWTVPIDAGLLVASFLDGDGWRSSGAATAGLMVGLSVYLADRILARKTVSMLIRLPVLILFAGAAAGAGHQAGSALAHLGGLDSGWQRGLALATTLLTAVSCWREMVPRPVGGHLPNRAVRG